MLETVAMAFKL